MSPTAPLVQKICKGIVAVSVAWFVFCAFWGIGAEPLCGHLGAAGAAQTMLAEQILIWKQPYPLFDWYTTTEPGLDMAYCHHPYGMFWLLAVSSLFFFHKAFTPVLPAAILSTLMPIMLASIGKRIGGHIGGAAAALGFVVVPLAAGYATFTSLEVVTMFGVTLWMWGHLRYEELGKRRHLAASLLGMFFAASGDWIGLVIVAPVLGWALLRAWILPEWMTPPIKKARFHKWWALSVALGVMTLVLHLGLFQHAQKLMDWFSSGESRSGSPTVTLDDSLTKRAHWIDFSFTPVAIWVGKAVVPIACIRVVARRREVEVLSLSVLVGATIQYVGFKQGADIHIFWPHYFALYFALALAQLASTFDVVLRFVLSKIPRIRQRAVLAAGIVAVIVCLTPPAIMAPDTVRSLKIWRETGGRYTEMGVFQTNGDMLWVFRNYVRPRVQRTDTVMVHPSMPWNWEFQWALFSRYENAALPNHRNAFWSGRPSAMDSTELQTLVEHYHARFFGDDVIVVDSREPAAPLDAYSLNEREPNVFEWLVTNPVQPVRSLASEPDPYLTWELRHHFKQRVAVPSRPPANVDEIRIAHNIALSQDDTAGAERLREQIEKALDRTPEARFSGGHTLIGIRITEGVLAHLEVWFIAGGPMTGDATFSMHSVVIEKAKLSTIPPNGLETNLAYPPAMPTKLWKKGYMYRIRTDLRHRIGVEHYYGTWAGTGAPSNPGGRTSVDLAWVR